MADKRKLLKWILIVIGSFFGLIVIIGVSLDTFSPGWEQSVDAENKKNDSIKHAQELQESIRKKEEAAIEYEKLHPPYIVKTIQTLKSRFNTYSLTKGLNFRINNVDIDNGDSCNTFRYMLDDNIALIGALNKVDNSIKSLTMIQTWDDEISVANAMINWFLFFRSVDNTLKDEDMIYLLKKLGLFNKKMKSLEGLEKNTIKNGIIYSIAYNEQMGLWLSAETAK